VLFVVLQLLSNRFARSHFLRARTPSLLLFASPGLPSLLPAPIFLSSLHLQRTPEVPFLCLTRPPQDLVEAKGQCTPLGRSPSYPTQSPLHSPLFSDPVAKARRGQRSPRFHGSERAVYLSRPLPGTILPSLISHLPLEFFPFRYFTRA
jgi:hypothetical protein